MAEWLFEKGIGENRAILVDGARIVEAGIELPGSVRAGSVVEARLTTIIVPGRRGIAGFEGGEALVEPLPRTITEGQAVRIEIVREALAEGKRSKLAKCRITELKPVEGPSLLDRVRATGLPVSAVSSAGSDQFEAFGWSELLEEASSGEIAFAGGALRMSLTPAMTLFDVDGALEPAELAVAGAAAAGRTIRRLAIGGSVGIDLPTLGAKTDRQAAAAALDSALPQPFERTAVNGFGFLQVVRRRERPSIAEIVQEDRIAAAARALLRRAERSAGAGERTLFASPAVIARLEANPGWLEQLGRRMGAAVRLAADQALSLGEGHVQSRFA